MSLSCGCNGYDGDYEHWWVYPEDFTPYCGKLRRRCASCRALIEIGADHVAVGHFRQPETEVEERICGDEVRLADVRLCAACGEIFLSLVEYGYCVQPNESLPAQLCEHWELAGYMPPLAAQGLAATEASA